MFYENLVILTGRAVEDAKLKDVGTSQVCSFRLANNKRVKNRAGDYVEKTCYIDCDAWGPRAEYASKYVKKGSTIRVVAELEQDEWTSNGQKRQKHKLYLVNIQVERPRGEDTSESQSDAASPASADDAASEEAQADLPF